ncbi:MAG TPA: DUF6064 family protein [Longimicrobiaceae bacterium]|nr:DUF6064 family protein [Longimicrobiaceae bacterium]
MRLPFSAEQFMGVFERYNLAVWPAQLLFYAAAVGVLVLVARPGEHGGRWISGVLAFLWAWMGVVYHWAFFARINSAAFLFAALFLLQAALFLAAGVLHPGLSFRARGGTRGLVGAALVGYALLGYPLVGRAAGHLYPAAPTFGLPCPTTIFTFGVLLLAHGRVPLRLLAIPLLWSLVGTVGAFSLGVPQDYGLPVAAVAATALLVRRRGRETSSGQRRTGEGRTGLRGPSAATAHGAGPRADAHGSGARSMT